MLDNMQRRLIAGTAADLLSVEGENAEYDRAIVELTSDILGISHDMREPFEFELRRMAERNQTARG